MDTVQIAVVGTGYWGINHVRSFARADKARVTWLCDGDDKARTRAAALVPNAQLTARFEDVLAAGDVDAVVIATPSPTHADLACQALDAGKHVLVEKPLALNMADAERVRAAADKSGCIVLVGHLMIYHPAVQRLREMVVSGELGDPYYLHARRVNLGRLRQNENALWSFAPHDLSMFDYILGEPAVDVTARGECYLQPGIEDVVFVSVRYRSGQMAHVHLSWLDPRKERRLTIVCSKKMAEFDDVSNEKLRIYDKGYDKPPGFTQYSEYLTIRQGDIHVPHLPMAEPLAVECRHFIDCVLGHAEPATGLDSAIRVVQVLAAAQESLGQNGAPVKLTSELG